jgi:hypothetical protein
MLNSGSRQFTGFHRHRLVTRLNIRHLQRILDLLKSGLVHSLNCQLRRSAFWTHEFDEMNCSRDYEIPTDRPGRAQCIRKSRNANSQCGKLGKAALR